MIREVNSNIYNFISDWDNSIGKCHHNIFTDSISVVSIFGSDGILIIKDHKVKLIYFDPSRNQTFMIDENDVLHFIDDIANTANRVINMHDRVNILLSIICKKAGVSCLSDLKNCRTNNYLDSLIDTKKYKKEYEYILDYIRY